MSLPPPSERIRLGVTDIAISPLGIGAWAWGDKFIWGYGKEYDDADLGDAFAAILQADINFIDTAEGYGWGKSERLVGQFTAARPSALVIATKCFPYPWRLSSRTLVSALKDSLGRLGRTQIDLYQMHWPFPPVSIESWMDAMSDALEAGLIRAVGVSNYNVDQTRRAIAALGKRGIPLASNQVHYHLLKRDPERSGLLQLCQEHGVTLIAYSPLAKGLLTGKYTPEHLPPGARGFRSREVLHRIQPLIALMREIGNGHDGKTPAQVALNWLICKGAVPIPGAKNARQVGENAGALGWRLHEAEIGELDRISDICAS